MDLKQFVRNCVCGAVCLGLIASGRVSKARRRALSGDVATAIYFHKPGKRQFRHCVNWLKKHGYTFISAKELLDILYQGAPIPKGAVWLSFDDCCKEVLENVLPVAREEKIPVTLFAPAGIVEGNGQYPWVKRPRSRYFSFKKQSEDRDSMTLAQLIEVAEYPEVTIGAHTMNHPVTPRCSEKQLRFELLVSKQKLESWAGEKVTLFAFPEGKYDGREQRYLQEFGYELAATTENAFITRDSDPMLLPRFSVADGIFYPEAICNMVGVWRYFIEPLKAFLGRSSGTLLRNYTITEKNGRFV